MSASIVAVSDPDSSSPSRLTVLKPDNEKVTVYVPGRKIHDAVLAVGPGDHGPGFLDEGWAGRFDGDAR